MRMDVQIFPNLEALSRAALAALLRILQEAVAKRGRFAISLAGGHTPAKLYDLWAEKNCAETPWDRVHLFWGDERYVSPDDALSNYRMVRETLIRKVPIPVANVHPIPTGLSHAREAAEAYEAELRNFFGSSPPGFDVQLLGLGIEGHTASLFPDSPALEETNRWVAAVHAPVEPRERVTLTPAVLNRGRNTFFLVSGAEKREILAALHNEPDAKPSRYPAGRIRPLGGVVWFLDQAAAGREI